MSVDSLYTQAVLDHHRAPRNFGALDPHTHAADGANPLCGDTLRIELYAKDGIIEAIRFRGDACAIATATTSMLSELAIGKSASELERLEAAFVRILSADAAPDESLVQLNAMSALAAHPVRRKCAMLPFATLRAAITGVAKTTTEEHLP